MAAAEPVWGGEAAAEVEAEGGEEAMARAVGEWRTNMARRWWGR